MKHKYLFPLLIFAVIIATNSCKKDPSISFPPGDANGALYVTRSVNYIGSAFDTTYIAQAWFGNDTNTQMVGNVTANDTPLSYTQLTGVIGGHFYNNYHVSVSGNNIAWTIMGNNSLGIPSFNFDDPAAFPPMAQFTLSSTVSLTSTLTVNFSFPSEVTGNITCAIYNSASGMIYDTTISASSNSVSFTPAEMTGLGAVSGDQLNVTMITSESADQIFAGKKYSFGKSSQFTASTTAY